MLMEQLADRGTIFERFGDLSGVRDGDIVLRLDGPDGGIHHLRLRGGRLQTDAASAGTVPHCELIGDARTVRAVIDGRKDARATFLAGGFRLRGDLRYASEVALALGLIDSPL
jgi:hypothetical protein